MSILNTIRGKFLLAVIIIAVLVLALITVQYAEVSSIESLLTSVKENSALNEIDIYGALQSITATALIIGSLIILLLFAGGHFLYKNINGSIEKVKHQINKLSKGDIISEHLKTKDEIGIILNEIEVLNGNLNQVKNFANEVGHGKFDTEINVFENKGEIGESLAGMRESLKQVSEEGKKRNWKNEGLAKFGDLLRKNSSDFQKLADEVISELINYLEANQGALFVLEEDDGEEKMVMKSCYAYDRKKFISEEIELGEGLIGQTWYEKLPIYLTEVPEDYINISSGLGYATPRYLFVMPLIINEEIFGVVELASFNEFQNHEIEFIKDISESIAASISSIRISENTQKLLQESQEMTEQMRSQEEEMRQNMEELEATQEEIARKSDETENLLKESEGKTESLNILIKLTAEITQEKSIEDACHKVLLTVNNYTGWQVGHVYLLNEEKEELYPTNIWALTDTVRFERFKNESKQYYFKKGVGLPGRVYESKKAKSIKNVSADPNFPRLELAKTTGLKGAFGFPVLNEGNIIAVMEFFGEKEEEINPSVLSLMEKVGLLLGNVVNNLRSAERIKLQAEELEKDQSALEESKKEVIAILDGLHESIFVFDENGIIKDANPKALKLAGKKKEEVENQNIELFFPLFKDFKKLEYPFRGIAPFLGNEVSQLELIVDTIQKSGSVQYLVTAREVNEENRHSVDKDYSKSGEFEKETKKKLLSTQKQLKELSGF